MSAAVNEWSEAAHAGEYLGHGREWPPHRFDAEAMLLSELPARLGRVLDLGCGDGLWKWRELAVLVGQRPAADVTG